MNFRTRNFKNSSSLIENIYINTYTYDFSVQPFINGLSDHDAQTITINNILNPIPRQALSHNRKFDSNSTNNFAFMLSFENWQDVFLFNNFLNTYLRIFYASFQTTKSRNYHKSKPWLTNGIRISCANKRKLHLTYRNTNDPNLKDSKKTPL